MKKKPTQSSNELALFENDIQKLYKQGLALHQQGKIKEARMLYKQVLEKKTDHFQALHLSGLIAIQTQEYKLAVNLISKALQVDPNNSEAISNRGVAFQNLMRFEEAIKSYEIAIQLNPVYLQAYINLGVVYEELNRFEEAIKAYDIVIKIKPNYPEAFYNRGNVFQKLKHFEAAIENYDEAIKFSPNYPEAYFNRGVALQELKRLKEALISYDTAILFNAHYSEAYSNRGVVLKELGFIEQSLINYDIAIGIKNDFADAYFNRANALKALMRVEEALVSFDKAIEHKFENFEAYWNKSIALLLLGKFEQGWTLYEFRWKIKHFSKRHFHQPLWLGLENLKNKTILLHSEQGLGDTIQFCRYVRLVKALGARVLLEVPKPLLNLLKGSLAEDEIFEQGNLLPDFDFHCPMMSLPLAFKTTIDSIPKCADLQISDFKKNYWSQKLGLKERLRVGIVWSGGFRPNQPELWSVNERRNLPLEELDILKDLDIDFISLQKGEPAESEFKKKILDHWNGPVIKNYVDKLEDFSDTAALLMNIDLVIAVDTSTAHVAATLGKPVWLLNRYDTCWRWLLNRVDSPWYPSVRIYRQTAEGDWSEVMQRVKSDLKMLCN